MFTGNTRTKGVDLHFLMVRGIEFGMDITKPHERSILLENTLDILSDLRDKTHMTSAMAMLDERVNQGMVLAALGGDCDHCYVPRVGSHFDLHSTAPGKSLISFQEAHKREKLTTFLGYHPYTSKTCVDPLELTRMVNEDAQKGYSLDIGEYVEGINCIASCVCLNGTPLFALWITALSIDMPTDKMDDFVPYVLRAVKQMEQRLDSAYNDSSHHTMAVVDNAKVYIDQNFNNPALMDKYFDELSVSYSWFRKVFKDKYGLGPIHYQKKLLHERAKRLLKNTKLSVKEIAFQLNFDNQNYFSRAFKKNEGISPIAFREKGKKDR